MRSHLVHSSTACPYLNCTFRPTATNASREVTQFPYCAGVQSRTGESRADMFVTNMTRKPGRDAAHRGRNQAPKSGVERDICPVRAPSARPATRWRTVADGTRTPLIRVSSPSTSRCQPVAHVSCRRVDVKTLHGSTSKAAALVGCRPRPLRTSLRSLPVRGTKGFGGRRRPLAGGLWRRVHGGPAWACPRDALRQRPPRTRDPSGRISRDRRRRQG